METSGAGAVGSAGPSVPGSGTAAAWAAADTAAAEEDTEARALLAWCKAPEAAERRAEMKPARGVGGAAPQPQRGGGDWFLAPEAPLPQGRVGQKVGHESGPLMLSHSGLSPPCDPIPQRGWLGDRFLKNG